MKALRFTFLSALIILSQLVFAQTGQWKLAGNKLTGSERFGSTNNFPLRFIVDNSQRMTLTAGGQLGVGTVTPLATLHVVKGFSNTKPLINSTIVTENSSDNFINLLAPANNKTAILFGAGSNAQDGAIVYNNAAVKNGMQFNTGGAITHMTLTSAGFLGLGTQTPASELHVVHGNSSSGGLRLENNTTGGNSWTIFEFGFSDQDLGLGFNNLNRGFFDNASGAYFTISDLRAKKDIEQSPDVLGKLMQLQVKQYHFLSNKSSDKKHYGMIAQDVNKLFPEIVSHKINKDQDFYAVDYSAYGVIAIKAIQEQQLKIQEQDQTVKQQQEKISSLEDRIIKLEAIISNTSVINGSNNANVTVKETGVGTLEQNRPNPFSQNTVIPYHLPQATPGQINLFDANGALVKSFKVFESGQVVINGSELKPGSYAYTLMASGKVIASKKLMVLK